MQESIDQTYIQVYNNTILGLNTDILWLKRCRLVAPPGHIAVLPEFCEDHRGVEPEEDTEGKRDPLDDDPRKESVKLELVRSCIYFLYFKIVSYPQSKIAQDKEGHDLSPGFGTSMFFSSILLF